MRDLLCFPERTPLTSPIEEGKIKPLKPLWHKVEVSKHLRELLDRCFYTYGIDDVTFLDEPTIKALSAMVWLRKPF